MTISSNPDESSNSSPLPEPVYGAPDATSRSHSNPQARLIARLLELTGTVSTEPVSTNTVISLNQEVDKLEPLINSRTSESPAVSQRVVPETHPTTARIVRVTRRKTPSTHSYTTMSTSPELKFAWSVPAGPNLTTRPSTAMTRNSKPLDGVRLRNGSDELDPLRTLEKAVALQPFPRQSRYPKVEPTVPEDEDDPLMGSYARVSKIVLDDITHLVAELHLRYEEAHHIHELGLAANMSATSDLKTARQEVALLQRSKQEATVRGLSADMRSIKDALKKPVAEDGAGQYSRDAARRAVVVFTEKIERWRRACAEVMREDQPGEK